MTVSIRNVRWDFKEYLVTGSVWSSRVATGVQTQAIYEQQLAQYERGSRTAEPTPVGQEWTRNIDEPLAGAPVTLCVTGVRDGMPFTDRESTVYTDGAGLFSVDLKDSIRWATENRYGCNDVAYYVECEGATSDRPKLEEFAAASGLATTDDLVSLSTHRDVYAETDEGVKVVTSYSRVKDESGALPPAVYVQPGDQPGVSQSANALSVGGPLLVMAAVFVIAILVFR
jgi:hypothetical protein